MLAKLSLLALLPLASAFAPSILTSRHAVTPSASFAATGTPLALAPSLGSRRSAALTAPRMAGKGIDFPKLDGKGMRIGICHARWNSEVVNKLRTGTKKGLVDICGVEEKDIIEFEVPGAWELPVAARFMVLAQKVDAVVCIGVLVKGETDHYDMIKDASCSALMTLQLETGIPVLNGILGCHDMAQAEARATGDNNHGVWWGQTAVEMATLRNTQMGKTPAGSEKKKVLF